MCTTFLVGYGWVPQRSECVHWSYVIIHLYVEVGPNTQLPMYNCHVYMYAYVESFHSLARTCTFDVVVCLSSRCVVCLCNYCKACLWS